MMKYFKQRRFKHQYNNIILVLKILVFKLFTLCFYIVSILLNKNKYLRKYRISLYIPCSPNQDDFEATPRNAENRTVRRNLFPEKNNEIRDLDTGHDHEGHSSNRNLSFHSRRSI